MKFQVMLILSLGLSFIGCGQETRKNVSYFHDTEAYELAKAVDLSDIQKINLLVKDKPELLDVTNPISGSNVLNLALTLENFEVFKKLLELGADPNFVNPYSKRSILIDACKFYWKPEPYTINLEYIELLLEYGANTNYAVEEDHTDEKGRSYMATSPLIEAAKLDLDMVKLLINAGANPYKKLKQNQKDPFSSSLRGTKYDIANYFIDSLKVNVTQPMTRVIQKPSNKEKNFYIQDYIMTKFLKAKIEGNVEEMDRLKHENSKIEEANQEGWEFIQKLESMGVDFKNYEYKK